MRLRGIHVRGTHMWHWMVCVWGGGGGAQPLGLASHLFLNRVLCQRTCQKTWCVLSVFSTLLPTPTPTHTHTMSRHRCVQSVFSTPLPCPVIVAHPPTLTHTHTVSSLYPPPPPTHTHTMSGHPAPPSPLTTLSLPLHYLVPPLSLPCPSPLTTLSSHYPPTP